MTGAVDCAEVASRWSCSGKADAAAVNDGGREYGVTGSSKTWVEGGRASSSNSSTRGLVSGLSCDPIVKGDSHVTRCQSRYAVHTVCARPYDLAIW